MANAHHELGDYSKAAALLARAADLLPDDLDLQGRQHAQDRRLPDAEQAVVLGIMSQTRIARMWPYSGDERRQKTPWRSLKSRTSG